MALIDCHTHTQYSMDSEADINGMIERARELGLAAYAVTDHCECNCWYPKEHYVNTEFFEYFNYAADFESSVSAVTALKERFDGFDLICGTELGQAVHDLEIAEKVAADSRLDFIIASIHQIRNAPDFFYINYRNMTSDELHKLLESYFLEISELCKWGKFDVLGHLTYCGRYMKIRHNIEPDFTPYEDIIYDSLKTLAENGKGIEINTSGIRQGYGSPFPSLKYVKMFREVGGEVISIGSDAHKVADLGSNIADGTEIAKLAGFDHVCYFKNRKPNFIKI